MERLYVRNEKRADEEDGKHYSHLLGLHTLPWQSDSWASYVEAFNQTTDRVIAAQSKVKTRADASKLSKDKTRMLQFCPTLDLLEKVFEYLLPGDDVSRMSLSPEELVRQIARKDITEMLNKKSTYGHLWQDPKAIGSRESRLGEVFYFAVLAP